MKTRNKRYTRLVIVNVCFLILVIVVFGVFKVTPTSENRLDKLIAVVLIPTLVTGFTAFNYYELFIRKVPISSIADIDALVDALYSYLPQCKTRISFSSDITVCKRQLDKLNRLKGVISGAIDSYVEVNSDSIKTLVFSIEEEIKTNFKRMLSCISLFDFKSYNTTEGHFLGVNTIASEQLAFVHSLVTTNDNLLNELERLIYELSKSGFKESTDEGFTAIKDTIEALRKLQSSTSGNKSDFALNDLMNKYN